MNDCIFCKILKGEIPSKKLYEDDKVIVIMDVNPKVDGHALVIPKEHVVDFVEISDELLAHVYKVARIVSKKIMTKLEATALTLGVNYGDSQMVKHFHLHLLPNYEVSTAGKDVEEIYNILKED